MHRSGWCGWLFNLSRNICHLWKSKHLKLHQVFLSFWAVAVLDEPIAMEPVLWHVASLQLTEQQQQFCSVQAWSEEWEKYPVKSTAAIR